ncbi:glycosyltransferase [Methylobacterium symbioticum]|uniref:Glycosyltransferase 2-like domain-containing protein n=1 Tax=Methylobacterium symbioticum TaxID=2584084 RepID=A0A509EKQ1_9HYPH|nr:glycosyltransferase [Methylobacterium symbioticum]VUD74728.1 hypothetical protein MET9862_05361 [Methylobacterium symbioticum]
MTDRATPAGDADAVLCFLAPRRRDRAAALRALARHPGRVLGLVWAWLSGKRLRARQRLAALIGIEPRLMLPPEAEAHYLGPSQPALGSEILLLGGPGHALAPGAGTSIRTAFADAQVQALYGDALVQLAPSSVAEPLLRPAFDPDYLAALDYVGPVVALRREAIEPAGIDPARGAADALFRIHERFGAAAIGHLPRILSVWRPWQAPERGGEGRAHAAAVRAHLDRTGRAETAVAPDGEGVARLLHPLPEPAPLVSLIVPTRDRLDLLRPCVDGLLGTDWPALELLICDNDSREPETLAYLRDLEARACARIVPCPGPFNFAAMNNAAAAVARGRLLVFVNNDVTVLDPGWLDRMAREALRPDVGAVGAKLIDGAGRIQHGGIVLGTGGLVTHAYRHVPGDAPGHLGGLRATHAVSAVTAACLAVEAGKFAAVGGFDAERFAVDFNDVDLCLRLNAAGYRTLLVPGAVLLHDEGLSRRWTPEAQARHAREVAALKERWGPLLAQDPHYHPGFDPDLSTHVRLAAGAFADEAPPVLRRAAY